MFDLVITDYAMRGMSGVELAAAVARLEFAPSVVMLTGYGALMNGADEVPAGVRLVLAKPVSAAELRGAIAPAVATRAPAEADT